MPGVDQLISSMLEFNFSLHHLWLNSQLSHLAHLWPASLVLVGILPLMASLRTLLRATLRTKRTKPRRPLVGDATRALLTLVTPTNVAWPVGYTIFQRPCFKVSSTTIQIRFVSFFELVRSGRLELRNPTDIQDLFLGKYYAYGYGIRITYGFRCWFRIIRWIAFSHFFGSSKRSPHEGPTRSCKRVSFQDSSGHSTTSADLPCIPVLNLDSIHPYHLGQTIRKFMDRLPLEGKATLYFTTLDSSISFGSYECMICCLPLITPLGYLGCYLCTSTPLTISLNWVVELLSKTSSVDVVSVMNISQQESDSIHKQEQMLVQDSVQRSTMIKQGGIEHWREVRFLHSWEAALLSAGLLNRWEVIVQRKSL